MSIMTGGEGDRWNTRTGGDAVDRWARGLTGWRGVAATLVSLLLSVVVWARGADGPGLGFTTHRVSEDALPLADGSVYIGELRVDTLEARHWLFDPVDGAVREVELDARFDRCLPTSHEGDVVFGYIQGSKPAIFCRIDLHTGVATWIERPPDGATPFPELVDRSRTDLHPDAVPRDLVEDASVRAVQRLRWSTGEPVTVDGTEVLVVHREERVAARDAIGGLDLWLGTAGPQVGVERYTVMLPGPEGATPRWELEGTPRGHTLHLFDGVFRAGPDLAVVVEGAVLRTLDLRRGVVVREAILPEPRR